MEFGPTITIDDCGTSIAWYDEPDASKTQNRPIMEIYNGTVTKSEEPFSIENLSIMDFMYLGPMYGHTDCVTSIATIDKSDIVITASRDKSVILWKLCSEDESCPYFHGVVHHRLTGHSDAVQDVALSSDGQHALSGSSDGEIRLWDLKTGATARSFVGHTKPVLSVAFSHDNRHIISTSSDNTVKIWECKGIKNSNFHHPYMLVPYFVSGSWDQTVHLWNLINKNPCVSLEGHNGSLNNVVVSPDGSLCASGGKDGDIWLWNLDDHNKKVAMLETGSIIHALCFCPTRFWLCVATAENIQIWDLETQSVARTLVVDLESETDFFGSAKTQASRPVTKFTEKKDENATDEDEPEEEIDSNLPKADVKAFNDAELPKLKAKKPRLTHTQYENMLRELWEKSPDNPDNQVSKSPKQLCEPAMVLADASLFLCMQQKDLTTTDICAVLQSENVKLCTTSCIIAELAAYQVNNRALQFAMDAIKVWCGHGDAGYSSLQCFKSFVHDAGYVVATASVSLYEGLNWPPGIRVISFANGVLSLKNCSPQDNMLDAAERSEKHWQESENMTKIRGVKTVCYCTSLCWSVDGNLLFSGYTDGAVRVWYVKTGC